MKEIGKIVIASHNQGKISEIREMLAPFEIEVCSAEELNLPDVEETGTTFEENARLKAETLAKASGCLAWRTIPVCASMLCPAVRGFIPHVMRRIAILTREWTGC